jgi:hypothetical protein
VTSYRDQATLLRIAEKAYPDGYLEGLRRQPGGGYEVWQAVAKVLERVSLSVGRLEEAAFLWLASGAGYATGTVQFYRTVDSLGGALLTVAQGTIVGTTDGRLFVTAADVSFSGWAPDLGPYTVGIVSIEPGWEYNVPGSVTAADGEVLPGEITEIVKLNEPAGNIEPALVVEQLTVTKGGKPDELARLGADAGVPRRVRETDLDYLVRIYAERDTVSPGAIERGLTEILDPYRIAWKLREVGTPDLRGFFYDVDPGAVPELNFAYDVDPTLRPTDRWKCWLSLAEFRGFFVVEVPNSSTGEFGFAYDGSVLDTFSQQNAYDGTSVDAYPQVAAYDGYPAAAAMLRRNVWDSLNKKRAGGVGIDLVLG